MVLIQVNYLMLHGQCIKMCKYEKRKEKIRKKTPKHEKTNQKMIANIIENSKKFSAQGRSLVTGDGIQFLDLH